MRKENKILWTHANKNRKYHIAYGVNLSSLFSICKEKNKNKNILLIENSN